MMLIMLLAGIALSAIGLILFFALRPFISLTEAEIEMMRQDGRFEGEPDYMRTFRVARSEFDLEWLEKLGFFFLALSIAGILMIAISAIILIS